MMGLLPVLRSSSSLALGYLCIGGRLRFDNCIHMNLAGMGVSHPVLIFISSQNFKICMNVIHCLLSPPALVSLPCPIAITDRNFQFCSNFH